MDYKKLNMPTILAVSAILLFGHSRKENKIDKKLEYLQEYCENEWKTWTYLHDKEKEQEEIIKSQKNTIDNLLSKQMDLGAKLDSCIIINE